MAEKLTIPTLTIPDDAAKQLEDLQADLDQAEKEIAALKKMGIGVAALEEKLEWARGVRDTILTSFTREKTKGKK